MDQTVRNEGDFIDSELSAEESLVKARITGNRMPSRVIIRNDTATSETNTEDDNNNKNTAEEAEEPLSSNDDAMAQKQNLTVGAHLPQSRPGAFGSAPGKAESSRIKGALTEQPDPAKQSDSLSMTISNAPFTNSNAETQDIAPTIESGLPNPLGHQSRNVQSTVDELHLQARARKEAKKMTGGTVERMRGKVMERKLDPKFGLVSAGPDVVVGDKEVASRFPEDEESMEIGPRVQDLNLGSPSGLVTEKSALNLAIAAEVVDDNPAFLEAQIQERLNLLRDEMVRDTVQADAVKVTTESELPVSKHQYVCWLTLILIFVTVGVTLGIVLSRRTNDPQPQPLQSPPQPICTLCLNGSTGLEYPDRQLPRQREEFSCGSVAGNPELVTELLAGSSGNCSTDVQIYGRYCGCPSIAENTGARCNFCRFGFHPSKDLLTPVYNDSCVELESFVSTLSGELCTANSVTDVLACSAYCQCPASKHTCSLCPNIADTPFQRMIDAPLFNMTCGDLSDYVSIFTADQCTAYQEDLPQAAGICGCPPLSCSLCEPDGLKPEDVSLLSYFNNYSCAALNGIIGGLSEEDCTAEQALISENNVQCCTPTPPTSQPTLSGSMPDYQQDDILSPSTSVTSAPPSTLTCQLCPGGVSPPNPDLALSNEGTCGELSVIANGLSSGQCVLQEDVLVASAVSCGCS